MIRFLENPTELGTETFQEAHLIKLARDRGKSLSSYPLASA